MGFARASAPFAACVSIDLHTHMHTTGALTLTSTLQPHCFLYTLLLLIPAQDLPMKCFCKQSAVQILPAATASLA